MSVLATETQNKVASCRGALHAVEKHLEPLFAKTLPEVTKKLAPLEGAELQVGLAYTVASLYFCHLLTQGVDPSEHPIRQELDRIQLYFKKVRTTAEEIREQQQASVRMRVDSEAAKRIVQHYTSAADAASQRHLGLIEGQASSSSSGLAPQPPQTEELDPPRKRRKTEGGKAADKDGDSSSTEEEEADGAVAMKGVTQDAVAHREAAPTEPTGAPPAAAASAPVAPVAAAASKPAAVAAKPPPPALPSVAKSPVKAPPPAPFLDTGKAPVSKAPVVKFPPPSLGKAAQLRPMAAPHAAAAGTPQGPAAESIFAAAKADAKQAAVKKKKKKAASKAGAAVPAAKAAATAAASPAPAEDDPYGAVVDDPYAA